MIQRKANFKTRQHLLLLITEKQRIEMTNRKCFINEVEATFNQLQWFSLKNWNLLLTIKLFSHMSLRLAVELRSRQRKGGVTNHLKDKIEHQVLLYFSSFIHFAGKQSLRTENYRLHARRFLERLFPLNHCSVHFTCCISHGNIEREVFLFGWTINHERSKALRWKTNGLKRSNGGRTNYRLLFEPFLLLSVWNIPTTRWSRLDSNFIHKQFV